MEDVLEVYQRPIDDARPLVCLDEFAKQLPFESRTLIAATRQHAACLDYLSNHVLPEADKIVLVLDNLNTHKEASPYEAFPPAKACALCERFMIHYTPKHGSWLNMAEIEIGLLVRGCLDRRIGFEKVFRREVAAYLVRKNENPNPINWQFTDDKARINLKSIYPAI